MTFARVRDAAAFAARRAAQSRQPDLMPHELAALSWLDQNLTDDQRQQFTDLWRAQGSPAAAQPAGNTFDALRPLLDLIAAGEGGYTSINRGRAGDTPGGAPGLTGMTIAQVQARQAIDWFAVGRYQFIPETLLMAAKTADMGPETVFNEETQDWLAVALLLGGKRPKLRDYLQGKDVPLEEAQLELAKEWASIPMANGRGFYDGDKAGNRASAKVPKVQAALKAARADLAGRELPQLKIPAQQPTKPAPPAPHLTLTRTKKSDTRGLEILMLRRVKDGIPMGELKVVSGAPGRQQFRSGMASKAGSMEPLPEGLWHVADIAWAGGKDNYNASWGPGLGPASVPLSYEGPGRTERSAIEAHYDANHGNSPGTAGCIGFNSIADLKTFIGWLRADNPRRLIVDWGLGTISRA